MNKKLTLLLLLLAGYVCSYAQYNLKENNVWAFGLNAGLNFNNGVPVPIQTGINSNGDSVEVSEGCASVCDTGGNLLFYASGDTIWNRNNVAMPNGSRLTPVAYPTPCGYTLNGDSGSYVRAESSTQGALIVPVLDNPNQYYVFSLQSLCSSDPGASRLYYSVVDMTLNNGLGDVLPDKHGILIDSVLSEKMISVPGDNCDMWLLVHGNQNDTFKAYDITTTGVSPVPVLSAVGNISGVLSYSTGTMKVSPNRRKLVAGSIGYFALGGVGAELYDFDPATGEVSNAVTISTDPVYGICFSPDNSKLYLNDISVDPTTYASNTHLSQYDISLSTITAIVNSRVDLVSAPNGQTKDFRLGPDGKIYMPGPVRTLYETGNPNRIDSLDVINNPNLAGTVCNFVHNAFSLLSHTRVASGMPNMYMKPLRDTISTTTDTSMVLTSNLTLQIPSGYFNYLWNDGSTDSDKVITDTGTYWVKYGNYCTYRTDTFVVRQATGIANINGAGAATLTAYPSPARNIANVTIHGLNKVDGTLQLIDMVGRTVLQQPCTNKRQTLDVGSIAPGIYTVLYTDKASSMQLHQQLVITR